jgi:hypothetical protein
MTVRADYERFCLFSGEQFVGRAVQRFADSDGGRDQDVRLASLDFLDISDVQPDQFRQTFLSNSFCHPFTANICAQLFQLVVFILGAWHRNITKAFLT